MTREKSRLSGASPFALSPDSKATQTLSCTLLTGSFPAIVVFNTSFLVIYARSNSELQHLKSLMEELGDDVVLGLKRVHTCKACAPGWCRRHPFAYSYLFALHWSYLESRRFPGLIRLCLASREHQQDIRGGVMSICIYYHSSL